MTDNTLGLVDIVRDFLVVDQALRRLLDRYRTGSLEFDEVQALFSDHESSPLFRLKERCHAIFRGSRQGGRVPRHQEVLFDLAVGSLFHEAMKFRESFYQREVYGPRIRALREGAGDEAAALFGEFERIEVAVSERLEEGLAETEALLGRTRDQLAVLVAHHPQEGHVARLLVEKREKVEAVFERGLDAVFSDLYGEAAAGWALSGRSYLESGYFAEAEGALTTAIARGGDARRLEPLTDYARGMAAYLKGEYASSIEHLGRWVGGEGRHEAGLVELAHTAVSKIDQLAYGADREEVMAAALPLAARLAELRRPHPPAV